MGLFSREPRRSDQLRAILTGATAGMKVVRGVWEEKIAKLEEKLEAAAARIAELEAERDRLLAQKHGISVYDPFGQADLGACPCLSADHENPHCEWYVKRQDEGFGGDPDEWPGGC